MVRLAPPKSKRLPVTTAILGLGVGLTPMIPVPLVHQRVVDQPQVDNNPAEQCTKLLQYRMDRLAHQKLSMPPARTALSVLGVGPIHLAPAP